LFVRIDDDFDWTLAERMEHREHDGPGVAEDLRDAEVLEALHHDFCTVHFFHAGDPAGVKVNGSAYCIQQYTFSQEEIK